MISLRQVDGELQTARPPAVVRNVLFGLQRTSFESFEKGTKDCLMRRETSYISNLLLPGITYVYYCA